MNKKVLLIENRLGRMLQYLPNGKDDVDKLSSLKCLQKDNFSFFLDALNNDDLSSLSSYDLIMIHRSALGELSNGSKINTITTYCKKNNKGLIYFSGGISSSLYIDDGAGFLLINSKDFYSLHLIPFIANYCEGKATKLVELKYGSRWKLTYLLQLREYIALNKIENVYDQKIMELSDIVKLGTPEILDSLIREEIIST